MVDFVDFFEVGDKMVPAREGFAKAIVNAAAFFEDAPMLYANRVVLEMAGQVAFGFIRFMTAWKGAGMSL